MSAHIEQLVNTWLEVDRNEETICQIKSLYENKDFDKLQVLLGSRITFGTAGLRAKTEAGFSRMNLVTVLQTCQGLASYIKNVAKGATRNSIVIGHDHRVGSSSFAKISAVVFLMSGFKVYYVEQNSGSEPQLAATPLVPFAVDYFGASCGVMVTASHNPAQDNGYKVYWSNGCQIIPPHDNNIATSIMSNLTPWNGVWDNYKNFDEYVAFESKNFELVKKIIVQKYFDKLRNDLVFNKEFLDSKKNFDFVYTPVHGVGGEFASTLFDMLMLNDNCHFVRSQQNPDPSFKTVRFPNPEEKGALNEAIKTANAANVDLILANDPDADRFSAAVRTVHGFRQLTGNEIGTLFASYIWEVVKSKHKNSDIYMLNSTVSSQLIASMAKIEGFNYADTLTGFKWIGNEAIKLEQKGLVVPFAYEEAIGFMFSNVHDKDGIAAMCVFLQMYDYYTIQQGITLIEKLEKCYQTYGYFKEYNGYYKLSDLTITPNIFEKIRQSATPFPATIGRFSVKSWRDLTTGYDSTTSNYKPTLPVDHSSQMITVVLKTDHENQSVRFTARGSGTEPKLKVYIEGTGETEEEASSLAKETWEVLKSHWFKPDFWGLQEVCNN